MEQTLESFPGQVRDQYTCESCGRRSPLGWMFAFKRTAPANAKEGNEIIKCLFDALHHPPLVRRSLKVALVVGSLLALLNQGDILLAGNWSNDLYWKIPLTYCVPFGVATFGALSAARR
jgi:hypothetical protein